MVAGYKKQFDDLLAHFIQLLGIVFYVHPIKNRGGTGSGKTAIDLNGTDPAGTLGFESLEITECRDIHPVVLCGIDKVFAFFCLALLTVNDEIYFS
jgi:hypothetical protein